ncbi:hypothetical protein [Sphingosinicella sp. YJ22]|uniref:hypothetical protein n=1 Tax=Sphingosinicella sp. YJ22 TaxID=1104780 RepID=UPI00140E691E|nr:hypothetical protein [Sphingosinicella sp. YJ22]
MAEEGRIDGVKDADIAATTARLPKLPNVRAELPERFAQGVRSILERRAQSGWPGEDDNHEVAAFVMVEKPRAYQARFSTEPITDPIATKDRLFGRVLFLTRDAGGGQVLEMPCHPNALLDWLHDEGLEGATLVLAYRSTAIMTLRVRGAAGELTREDKIRDEAPTATLAQLNQTLQHFHITRLLTPGRLQGLWESGRASKYVPGPDPERTIQKDLENWLNSAFWGLLRAEIEEKTLIGRIDVKLLIDEGEKALTYWAIVELKVIKSFANAPGSATPSTVSRTTNLKAIEKGLRQAWAYQKNRKAEHGLLEVYDMREDKEEDLFSASETQKVLAELAPVPSHAVRELFGSADDARFAGYAG